MNTTKALVPFQYPDTQDLSTERAPILREAEALAITSQVSYDGAVGLLRGVKALRNKIAERFEPVRKAQNEAHKALIALIVECDEPLAQAEVAIKGKIIRFAQQQEAIRQQKQREAEEALRQEQEDLRLMQAMKAQESGAPEEEIKAVLEAPIVEQRVEAAPTYARDMGVTVRKPSYAAEVVNFAMLVRAAVKLPSEGEIFKMIHEWWTNSRWTNSRAPNHAPDGHDLVERINKLFERATLDTNVLCLLSPNQTALNNIARAAGDKMAIPGVKAVEKRTVAVR